MATKVNIYGINELDFPSSVSASLAQGVVTLSGFGTVTSFSAGNIDSIATTSVATSTTTPALTFALSTQTANTVWAGPTTGAAAAPTFRALVAADIPSSTVRLNLTAQSAAITATTLLSAPQTGAYRVSWSADITTVDLVSSILGGTNGFQVIYTSPTDSVVKTTVAGASITSAANTTGTATSGVLTVYAKNATNIQFTYDYTSATPGQMIYEIHISVEVL